MALDAQQHVDHAVGADPPLLRADIERVWF
jgi:hypothetical protein